MVSDIGFYGIISQPRVGWVRMAEVMVERGVRWIQLRMKQGDPGERLRVAAAVRQVIPAGFHMIVNDLPELALEVGADGVHLGQDDASYARAREILGPGALIGLSTHSPDQVRAACDLNPSYLGMGPVFATLTKVDAEPTIGPGGLEAMVALASVPAVAIGGIGLARVLSVEATGVQGFCAVGPVNDAQRPGAVIAAFQRSFRDLRT